MNVAGRVRKRRSGWAWTLLMVLAVVCPFAVPGGASAHATLESSSPAAGTVVRSSPGRVELKFSESVEGNFGALRVFDPAGHRVDTGGVFHPDGRSEVLAVDLESELPGGTSTVTWRVVSADSHVVSGGFTFSIGRPSVTGKSVAQLNGGIDPPLSADVGMGVAHAGQFGAIAIALGAVLFLLLCWRRLDARAAASRAVGRRVERRIATVVGGAAFVGASASVLGLAAEGALAEGTGLIGGFAPSTLGATLGTRFGLVWAMAVIAWGAVGIGVPLLAKGARSAVVLALPLGWLSTVPALSGHAANRDAPAAAAVLDVTHVCAVSAWLGGVVVLLVAVLPAVKRAGSGRLAVDAVDRFSRVALPAVAAVVVTGVGQAVIALDSPDRLVDTDYGRAILVKCAAVCVLVAIGAVHRRIVIPGFRVWGNRSVAIDRARRLLLVETVVFALVLAATAVLAGASPNAPAASGPASRTLEAGPLGIALVVDPARPGANSIHMQITRASDGSTFDRALEVSTAVDDPERSIGPFRQTAHKAGPGHWISTGATLPGRGDWRVSVTVRVSEFDEWSAATNVPVG